MVLGKLKITRIVFSSVGLINKKDIFFVPKSLIQNSHY